MYHGYQQNNTWFTAALKKLEGLEKLEGWAGHKTRGLGTSDRVSEVTGSRPFFSFYALSEMHHVNMGSLVLFETFHPRLKLTNVLF